MNILTDKDIESMIEKVNNFTGLNQRYSADPFRMNSIFGMKVIEAPRKPKMQLSADCPVTDDFRKEMNDWLIEFFGYESFVPINTAYVIGGSHIIMRPEMVVKLANIGA